MEIVQLIFQFFALLLIFIFGYFLSMIVLTWLRIRKLGSGVVKNDITFKRVKQNLNIEFLIKWLLRNGIAFLKFPSKKIIQKIPWINKYTSWAVLIMKENSYKTSKSCLLSVYIFFALISVVIFSFIFLSVMAGISVVLCVTVILLLMIKSRIEKRVDVMRNEMPDSLKIMASCFELGYTINQTFEYLSKESKGLLKKLFSRCSNILKTGGSVEESLSVLKENKEISELGFVSIALNIQHQTGGSMAPIIESTKDMVDSKLEILRMLKVQTAQAKLSAKIVIVMPFILIAVFSIMSPEFLNPFFSSFLGVCMFIVAFIMQAAGIIIVRKTLDFQV